MSDRPWDKALEGEDRQELLRRIGMLKEENEALCRRIQELREKRRDSDAAMYTALRRSWEAPMLGVLSRQAFIEYCTDHMMDLPDQGICGVMILLEVDHFQEYTLDTQDDILIRMSKVFYRMLRSRMIPVRYGRERFLVYLQAARTDAEHLKERLELRKRQMEDELQDLGKVTLSIGAAFLEYDPLPLYKATYENANKALLAVRQRGGNGVEIYSAQTELSGLRQVRDRAYGKRPQPESPYIRVRTFGYFDIFVNGEPVRFSSEKAKELLALLVDRRGGYLSTDSAISCLWEDEEADRVTRARLRKVAMRLKETLEEHGIADIVHSERGGRRIDPSKISCDLYDYLSSRTLYEKSFTGYYMLDYSWGEITCAELERRYKKE